MSFRPVNRDGKTNGSSTDITSGCDTDDFSRGVDQRTPEMKCIDPRVGDDEALKVGNRCTSDR